MKTILIISLAFLFQSSPSCTERLFGNKAAAEKPSFSPYQGSLETLLPKDAIKGLIRFKQETTQAIAFKGSTAAIESNYTMEAGSLGTSVQFKIANFPSAQAADAAIQIAAKEMNAPLVPKKNGQRFTGENDRAIVWTNGSLLCIAYSQFAKTTSNFEETMLF